MDSPCLPSFLLELSDLTLEGVPLSLEAVVLWNLRLPALRRLSIANCPFVKARQHTPHATHSHAHTLTSHSINALAAQLAGTHVEQAGSVEKELEEENKDGDTKKTDVDTEREETERDGDEEEEEADEEEESASHAAVRVSETLFNESLTLVRQRLQLLLAHTHSDTHTSTHTIQTTLNEQSTSVVRDVGVDEENDDEEEEETESEEMVAPHVMQRALVTRLLQTLALSGARVRVAFHDCELPWDVLDWRGRSADTGAAHGQEDEELEN